MASPAEAHLRVHQSTRVRALLIASSLSHIDPVRPPQEEASNLP